MSGYARTLSPLVYTFDEANLTAISDAAKGYLPAMCNLGIGTINANLDTTETVGSHAVLSVPGVSRNVMIPVGINAEPAQGDAVYMGNFQQASYLAAEDGGAMTVSIGFSDPDASALIGYDNPWGVLLRPKTATTAANTSAGVDGLAASTYGGYLAYQVFAGDGTATISVDKSTTTNVNASFSALSGATTGSIDCSTPKSGFIALANPSAVGQFLRWQIALGTANTVTFALAFVRGKY
jgi:hypothetical protein